LARTRLIDDTVADALARGMEQLVILGAGFDARAYRLPGLSDVAVFEVDHPATLAKKRSVLRRASLDAPSRVRSVGIDFRSADLAPVMDAAGYSTQARRRASPTISPKLPSTRRCDGARGRPQEASSYLRTCIAPFLTTPDRLLEPRGYLRL
jgi:hypothetical protein